MEHYVPPLARLIDAFERLPGIGRKTAQRLAFFVLGQPPQYAADFAAAITGAKQSIRYCGECQNLTDAEICPICLGAGRDRSVICVVEDPRDVVAFERTREYHGLYHVLHGVISPMDNVGPEDIKLKELLERIHKGGVEEVIMATNPDVEGEATAMYVAKLLTPLDVRVTRIANGIPVGGDLEYADEMTLLRALEGRKVL